MVVLGAGVVVSFAAGLLSRNYSHVDRLWSVLPAVYVLIWMRDFYDNMRFVIPGVLVCLWAIRLTANFAVKGGYRFSWKKGFTEEDYRWPVLKEKIPNRVLFELFNLTFISSFQLALIFVFTLPLYFVGEIRGQISPLEMVLYAVHGVLLLGETVADIQQLRYYRRRSQPQEDARLRLGFNTFGLWRFSRHPNYVCEMGQWIVVFFYLAAASGALHWSGIGAGVLMLLFIGSTRMAEQITSSKYPAYKDWQRATAPWIPSPFRTAARHDFWNKYKISENEE